MIQKLKTDLTLIEKKKSDLNTQLVEAQSALENFKHESSSELERQVEAYRQQRTDFEHTFKDTLSEKQRLEKELDEMVRKLAEKETLDNTAKSNSDFEQQIEAYRRQQAVFEQQASEFLNEKQRLEAQVQEALAKLALREAELKEKIDSTLEIEQQLDTYRKQTIVFDQRFNEQVDLNQRLSKDLEETALELVNTKREMESILNSFNELSNEKVILVSQIEALNVEQSELNERMSQTNDEMKEFENLKKSEFAELAKIFESNEQLLNQQIKDLTEKFEKRYCFYFI
jgi:chromosome segregation ATPase